MNTNEHSKSQCHSHRISGTNWKNVIYMRCLGTPLSHAELDPAFTKSYYKSPPTSTRTRTRIHRSTPRPLNLPNPSPIPSFPSSWSYRWSRYCAFHCHHAHRRLTSRWLLCRYWACDTVCGSERWNERGDRGDHGQQCKSREPSHLLCRFTVLYDALLQTEHVVVQDRNDRSPWRGLKRSAVTKRRYCNCCTFDFLGRYRSGPVSHIMWGGLSVEGVICNYYEVRGK